MLRNRIFRPVVFGFVSCFVISALSAQSTISDKPFELSYGSGPLGVLLPSYSFGAEQATGDPAYQDDLDNLGGLWEVNAIRRFLGTRTSLEAKAFFGMVEANAIGSDQLIEMPNPNNGVLSAPFSGQTHLESELFHYGTDIGLRDTWRTRFGGLSAGTSFSYMAFDQDFELDLDGGRLIKEDLNSDFVGIKGILGWDGRFLGRRSKLDLGFGYYDLDVEYDYVSPAAALNQSFATELNDDSSTIEIDFSTYFCFRGFDTALNLGFMYITDMPTIVHEVGAPASIGTDDAILLNAQLQMRL